MLIQGINKSLNSRETIPERPQGQRTEIPRRNINDFFHGFQINTGTPIFHFGAFGILPLFLQLALNSRNLNSQNEVVQGSSDVRGFLSRLFLMIGILFLFVIVLY